MQLENYKQRLLDIIRLEEAVVSGSKSNERRVNDIDIIYGIARKKLGLTRKDADKVLKMLEDEGEIEFLTSVDIRPTTGYFDV